MKPGRCATVDNRAFQDAVEGTQALEKRRKTVHMATYKYTTGAPKILEEFAANETEEIAT